MQTQNSQNVKISYLLQSSILLFAHLKLMVLKLAQLTNVKPVENTQILNGLELAKGFVKLNGLLLVRMTHNAQMTTAAKTESVLIYVLSQLA